MNRSILKYKNTFYTLLLVMTISFSCKKKEDPIPVIQTPELNSSLTLDGTWLNLEAGLNNISLEASYEKVDSLYFFTGTFLDGNGSPKLKFGFKDYKVRGAGENIDIDNVLTTGSTAYYSNAVSISNVYNVNFTSNSTGNNLTYMWDFGDNTGTVISSSTTISHGYTAPGPYSVQLTVDNGSGGSNSIVKNVDTQFADSNCQAQFYPIAQIDSNGINVSFFPDSIGTAPFSYSWDFGNGMFSTLDYPVTTYAVEGIYTVCLNQTDGGSCQSSHCENVAITSTAPPCMANYEAYFASMDTVQISNNQGTVYIDYYTDAGELYSTRFGDQTNQSFNIVTIADYAANKNGDPVKKLTVQYTAILYNQQGQSITLTNGNSSIGVAYF